MLKYIHIPEDWTGPQAWAVMEFLYQLEELVWDTYETELMEIVGPDPEPPPDEHDPDESCTDDDIPF